MKVSDIMIRDVYKTDRFATVKTALELFSRHRISGMPIVDEANHVVGYISDGDIMRHLAQRVSVGRHPFVSALSYYYGVNVQTAKEESADVESADFRRQVEAASTYKALDVGGRSVITISEDSELIDVVQMLSKQNIKKVPVISNGELVGIISRGDVVRTLVHRVLAL